MNERLKSAINTACEFIAFVMVLSITLLFWNLTTEFFETPKLAVLIFLTGLLTLLWAVKCLLSGKITFVQTPFNLPILLILIVFGLSTFFAPARSLAIFGSVPRVENGLLSFGAISLFFFMVVSNLRSTATFKYLLNTLFFVGTVLSVWTLLSYFKINLLPLNFTQLQSFTPTGSSFSTNAILILLLPLLFSSFSQHSTLEVMSGIVSKRYLTLVQKITASVVLALFTAVIILTGTQVVYIATSLVVVLSLISLSLPTIKKNSPFLALPALTGIILAVSIYIPIKDIPNPLTGFAQEFPREIQLPVAASWKVSVSAFRDFPVLGSGPGSYLNDFTIFKPAEINNTSFWNIRFDRAFNTYFETLATQGALGLLALLLLTIMAIPPAIKTLANSSGITTALAVSVIAFFILLSLHSATLVLWVVGFLLLAIFASSEKSLNREVNLGLGEGPRSLQGMRDELYIRFDILPIVVALVVLAAVAGAYLFTANFIAADFSHRKALDAISQNRGSNAYNFLLETVRSNPNIDLYRINFAQTNFALANAIASEKGPTEASPSGSLTDTDKQNIQTLLSQAISEGRAATVINPQAAANWEILASIYQQISGVAQNALNFSLDSYGRAIARDPLNPLLRLTTGGIYYSVKNYDMSIRFYSDVINLKPDFANGYYNLAIALRDKGNLAESLQAAEKTVSLLDPNTRDYEVAAKLLSDLKEKIPTEAQKSDNLVPAGQKEGALQGSELPKVLNLPKVENISTPEAVKK
ncbi:hypothetical protein A2617_01145 [Candidatus Daviesbacteria bacterium RIFOXYD1_FULL_41_10]|uniref:O-antigen ligase-related domain-containing protein n=2 Tax=Patescibacteria group TaxID=1783273 RepID=A0A1F5MZP1_9BACT|nr:MAG: hypothetical protein UW78_C0017G0017 [Candidatus Azambacteria bacterium GW2011_GWA1_44_9]OGE70835.1 MAG: hypothetical protein A2617_01145 [Candidatus Daviesbacteria bacterium RIFOXYD1_FULL_41_10]